MRTGLFNPIKSHIDAKNNAYYLQSIAREPDSNEKFVAENLVSQGISVEITPEGIAAFASAYNSKGDPVYVDGKLSLHTYEQKTIGDGAVNTVRSIKYGIDHAIKKNAEIAVIFDKHGKITNKSDIQEAITDFKLPKHGVMPRLIVIMFEDGSIERYGV